MKVSLIKSHPKNAEIYDPTDNSTLQKSIKENGLLEPIVVTKSGTILSGHRRFEVVNSLGWADVDVRVVDPENELVVLIECNRYRTKSERDILRESRILETQLRKQIGRGRNATKNRVGKSLTMDLELSKRLGVGTTKLKQLKSIERYDPKLLTLIENKKISVSAAYKKVREKFGSTTKKRKKNSFEIALRKLLSEHSPSYDVVTKTISKTYPYSLEKTGLSDFERDELKDQLLELSSMSSEQLMLLQKQDELEHSNCSRSQISVAKKLLPNAKELNSALLNFPYRLDFSSKLASAWWSLSFVC